MKTKWIGPVLLGFDWASDWKWDWTSDRGDEHSDFIAVARFIRKGYPPTYRIALGPICIMFMRDRDGTRAHRGTSSQ